MDLLQTLRPVACRTERRAFERKHSGLYLLATLPLEESDFDFTTAAVGDPMAAASRVLGGDAEALLANKALARVAKTNRNPWRSRITVGRAQNNDLIIRHPSVSKLHAYFENQPAGAGAAAPGNLESFGLMDPGSANGTTVNARRLEPERPVPVTSGDLLIFGDVECELFDASALHETIRAIFPTPELLGLR